MQQPAQERHQHQPQQHQWKSPRNSVISGASAGFVSSVVTCPLDVIKTKLQAQTAIKGRADYLGIGGTVKHILARDGIRGMYRGLGPTMLGYLPTWAIYFAVYDGIKSTFGDAPLGGPRHAGAHDRTAKDSWGLHILASMSAGATGTVVTSPLWVIKTRFMTQPAHEVRYRHTLDAFVTIYRNEGIPTFYRGLIPSLLGVTHVAIQFPLYEQLKMWFADRQPNPNAPLSQQTILLCTALSKFTATIITYPHEVVRTRLQIYRRDITASQHSPHPSPQPSHLNHLNHEPHGSPYRHIHSQTRLQNPNEPWNRIPPEPPTKSIAAQRPAIGTVQMARKILLEEGSRGFYKGLSINLVRTIPNSAVTMLTYELLMQYLWSKDELPSTS